MALLAPSVDYTNKDFESLKLRLRALIQSVFPEWTDFNVANFGNILIELFSHVGDVLAFYQDNQARQSRISTATQRRALLGLIKLIGYQASSATAAHAVCTITLPTPPAGTVTISAGTFVYTDEVTDPIKYQLLADAFITSGQNPPTVDVSVENSESWEESFVTSSLANQQFALGRTPYIDLSAVVAAGNGAYVQVTSLLDSGPSDRHYTVAVDQNDKGTLRFGNGINGVIPLGNINVEYKTGGGSAGRVEAAKLRRFVGAFSDSLGNAVQPTVTNAEKSVGGNDRQSVAQIKERAPASLRALTRCVSREDFEINALRLPDIARALMLTSNEQSGVPENSGILFIIPVGSGYPTVDQKAAVLNQVTVVYPCTLTFSVSVSDPVYRDVNVFAAVYFKQGVNKASGAALVRANLAAFFAVQNDDGSSNTNVDFGANVIDSDGNVAPALAYSDIFNVVRDTVGVRKIGAAPTDFTLNGSHDDVDLQPAEFPRLGTVTLVDGDTGAFL